MSAAVSPRDHFPPRRMPSVGSALTAIQEKPSAVKPETGTRFPPKANTSGRTSTPGLPPVTIDGVIQEGRHCSLNKLQLRTSGITSKQDYSGPKSPRRDSVTSVSSSTSDSSRRSSSIIRRSSFRTIGSRVTGLIRAKNAFRRIKKRPEAEEGDVSDDVYVIQEMPKYPRFASTLSAEAQYATLMGYEDIVYNRLTVSYPEYRTLLRRNHTPNTGVEVTGDLPVKHPKNVMGNVTEPKTTTPDAIDGKTGPSDSKDDSKDILESPISDMSDSPRSKEKKPRRKSPFRATFPASSTSATSSNAFTFSPPKFGRSKSLPQLVPENKQLVMTHRYQKAMDIYDVLRKSDGVNVLSPRIKELGKDGPPVKEFNSWSMVWKREFRSKTRLPSA